MSSDHFALLLKDCIILLTPRFVNPHSDNGVTSFSSPHYSLLLLLSDMYTFLFSINPHPSKEKQRSQSAAYKIRYYAAQVLSPSPHLFPADGVRFVVKELEVELDKRSSNPEVQMSSEVMGGINTVAVQGSVRGDGLIQELSD
jgi:hypothetical protein